MVRLRNLAARVRAQLWLLPALMTAAAALLAWVAIVFGGLVQNLAGESAWWLYSGDASTARDLLAAFLSGLITMTSLVVSVTVVILTTAASQLGPRLISYFMADRQIQFVLGLFIATTFYCILVLRTLDDTLGEDGIPHAAITVASVLTIACLFALLFYVHKIASSVIADNLVDEVWTALRTDIREILNEESGQEGHSAPLDDDARWTVSLERAGYVQLIDYGQLVGLACERDVVIRVNVRAGHFVLTHDSHVDVFGGPRGDADIAHAIRKALVIGSSRTPAQDLEHGLRQLVEIGLRSLSSGINDPFTAEAVINRLGAGLEEIFANRMPPHVLRDDKGIVRVIADRSDYDGLLGAAFHQIRQAGANQPAILITLARTLGRLAPSAANMTAKRALLAQLTRVEQTFNGQSFSEADSADIKAAIDAAREGVSVEPLVRETH